MKSALCFSFILLLGIAPAVALAQDNNAAPAQDNNAAPSQYNGAVPWNGAPWDGEAFFPDSGGDTGKGTTSNGATGKGVTGQGSTVPGNTPPGSAPLGSAGAGNTPPGSAGTGGKGAGGGGTNVAPRDGDAFVPDSGKGSPGRGSSRAGGAGTGGKGMGGKSMDGRGGSGGLNQGDNRGNSRNNNRNTPNNPSPGPNLAPVDRTPGLIQPDTLIRKPDTGGNGNGGAGIGAGKGSRGSLGGRGSRSDDSGSAGRGDGTPGGRGDGNVRGDGRSRGDGNIVDNNRVRGGNWNSDSDWRKNNRSVDNYANVTPRYYHGHGNWHRGDWSSLGGSSWGYQPFIYTGEGVRPGYFAFRYTTLAAPWTWGYHNYRNPYWVAPANVVPNLDYSQPIIAAAATAQQPGLPGVQQTPEQQAGVWFDKARVEFLKGNYQQALSAANEAVALTPNDAVLHEFRALCLFALKDYPQAAAGLYAVLSIGPGWDWETMSGLYGDVAKYTAQMKALEDYRRENPDVPEARFVLGYHYLVLGHKPQAAVELEKAVALKPDDQLSKQLLQGISAGDTQAAPQPEPTPDQALPANGLVGNWNAQSPDGSKFGLALNDQGEFQWTVSGDGQKEMAGTYKLENNYLILRASAENSLVGQVTMDGENKFVFKLAGNNPSDPGLTFTK